MLMRFVCPVDRHIDIAGRLNERVAYFRLTLSNSVPDLNGKVDERDYDGNQKNLRAGRQRLPPEAEYANVSELRSTTTVC